MKKAFLVLVLLAPSAAPAQETSDPLADDLRSLVTASALDALRTVETLAARGAAFLPALEAAAGRAEGRVRTYLELAAREIRYARDLRGAEPPAERYSLKSSDKSAAQILLDFKKRSGADLSFPDLLEEPEAGDVPVDVRDATLLQTLDAVCKAAHLSMDFEPGRIEISRGEVVDLPRSFFSHYMTSLTGYRKTRTIDFADPPAEKFTVGIAFVSDTIAQPVKVLPRATVLEARDDTGKNLILPPPPEEAAEADEAAEEEDDDLPTTFYGGECEPLELKAPAPAARRLAVLRGHVTLLFPKTEILVSIPAPAAGARASNAGFEAVVKGFDSPDATQHSAEIVVSSPKHAAGKIREMPLRVDVVIKGGRRIKAVVSPMEDDDTAAFRVDFSENNRAIVFLSPKDGRPALPELDRIEVRLALETVERLVPFEFRDLKIK